MDVRSAAIAPTHVSIAARAPAFAYGLAGVSRQFMELVDRVFLRGRQIFMVKMRNENGDRLDDTAELLAVAAEKIENVSLYGSVLHVRSERNVWPEPALASTNWQETRGEHAFRPPHGCSNRRTLNAARTLAGQGATASLVIVASAPVIFSITSSRSVMPWLAAIEAGGA